MAVDDCLSNDYFEVDSSIRGLPLHMDGNALKIALLEVGYKPKGKRGQVNWKRRELCRQNKNKYLSDLTVYRGVVHYQPNVNMDLDMEGYELDFMINYKRMSSRMLELFDGNDIRRLMTYVKDGKPFRGKVNSILIERDPDALEDFISGYGKVDAYSTFRGAIAELMALKDIMKENPVGVNFFKNVKFDYDKDGMKRDTEIDGYFAFYDNDRFIELFENLKKYDSLEVHLGERLS